MSCCWTTTPTTLHGAGWIHSWSGHHRWGGDGGVGRGERSGGGTGGWESGIGQRGQERGGARGDQIKEGHNVVLGPYGWILQVPEQLNSLKSPISYRPVQNVCPFPLTSSHAAAPPPAPFNTYASIIAPPPGPGHPPACAHWPRWPWQPAQVAPALCGGWEAGIRGHTRGIPMRWVGFGGDRGVGGGCMEWRVKPCLG